jgi:hypothetical protein
MSPLGGNPKHYLKTSLKTIKTGWPSMLFNLSLFLSSMWVEKI